MNSVTETLLIIKEQKNTELKNKLIKAYEKILDKDEEIKNLKIENESLRMAANSLKFHLNSKNNEERIGEWLHSSDLPDRHICSLCQYTEDYWWADTGTNYCPNCGSKNKVDTLDE